MRGKDAVWTSLLLLLLVLILVVVPARSSPENGPRTPDLLIHMYLNPDAEFEALEMGVIDIVDRPLSKNWIDKWVQPGYEDIRMVDCSEMAWHELTFNHQLWPTGWRNYTENPTIQLGGEPQPFVPDDKRHEDAKLFRKAVAYLNDVDRYRVEVLKGYGNGTTASMPYATMYGWINPSIKAYQYDKARAQNLLFQGGFRDYDGDSILEYDEDRDGVGFEELPPLEFWSRLDDPNRGDSADILFAELQDVGIPVNYHKEIAWPCYLHVMWGASPGEALPPNWPDVSHWLPGGQWMKGMKRFHLYTSRWTLPSPTPYHLYDQYTHWTITEGEGEFSLNYGGFYVGDGIPGTADDDWDYELWAERVRFGTEREQIEDAAFKAEEIAVDAREEVEDFLSVVPWFSLITVKAYKHNSGPDNIFEWCWEPVIDDTGWFGVANMWAYGVDNPWSFLNMYAVPEDSTIDWGFATEPFTLNVISSNQPNDWKALRLVYDSLIGCAQARDPSNLVDYPWLAVPKEPGPDGQFGTPENPEYSFDDVYATTKPWEGPDGIPDTEDDGISLTWTTRESVTWHNGDPFTPEDVRFSILFTRDCELGVAYNYPSVEDVHHVDTQAQDPALGAHDVKVYLTSDSYWATYYIGYLPIMSKNVWAAANAMYDWGYDMVNDQPGLGWDPIAVAAYPPWLSDVDEDGDMDLAEDGTGPWIFDSWVTGDYILLLANSGYYKTQEEIYAHLVESIYLHWFGNVNYEGALYEDEYRAMGFPPDIIIYMMPDGIHVSRAVGTNEETYPHGIEHMMYNEDADFNRDGKVDTWDYVQFGRYFGLNYGEEPG